MPVTCYGVWSRTGFGNWNDSVIGIFANREDALAAALANVLSDCVDCEADPVDSTQVMTRLAERDHFCYPNPKIPISVSTDIKSYTFDLDEMPTEVGLFGYLGGEVGHSCGFDEEEIALNQEDLLRRLQGSGRRIPNRLLDGDEDYRVDLTVEHLCCSDGQTTLIEYVDIYERKKLSVL